MPNKTIYAKDEDLPMLKNIQVPATEWSQKECQMQPHQQRVIDEKAELSERLDKLEAFHNTAVYAGLPAAEQSRLTRQLYIMKLYEQVLSERISAF